MAGKSQFFANVNRRKQGKIVTAGAHRLYVFSAGQFQHLFLVAKVGENVLVCVGVAQALSGVPGGNHVPSQSLCSLNQRDFGMPATEKKHFLLSFTVHFQMVQSLFPEKFLYLVAHEFQVALLEPVEHGQSEQSIAFLSSVAVFA